MLKCFTALLLLQSYFTPFVPFPTHSSIQLGPCLSRPWHMQSLELSYSPVRHIICPGGDRLAYSRELCTVKKTTTTRTTTHLLQEAVRMLVNLRHLHTIDEPPGREECVDPALREVDYAEEQVGLTERQLRFIFKDGKWCF